MLNTIIFVMITSSMTSHCHFENSQTWITRQTVGIAGDDIVFTFKFWKGYHLGIITMMRFTFVTFILTRHRKCISIGEKFRYKSGPFLTDATNFDFLLGCIHNLKEETFWTRGMYICIIWILLKQKQKDEISIWLDTCTRFVLFVCWYD